MKVVLSIAGSDPSGSAGIQLDLKVFSALGVWGCAVLTSLTAQNSTGVKDTFQVDGSFIYNQIKALAEDLNIDAVKIGMLLTNDVVFYLTKAIKDFKLKNIVLDTIIQSKNGKFLLSPKAINIFKNELIPTADIVTPNIPELEALTDTKIKSIEDIKSAIIELGDLTKGLIVVKGGHLLEKDKVVDIIFDGEKFIEMEYPTVNVKPPRGTGCFFSSAIAVYLAKGSSPIEAVKKAKSFINFAINNTIQLGKGYPFLTPFSYHS
jgi:hydroxymethylpyrimidine/phosphomethylpyrimidine kinase